MKKILNLLLILSLSFSASKTLASLTPQEANALVEAAKADASAVQKNQRSGG